MFLEQNVEKCEVIKITYVMDDISSQELHELVFISPIEYTMDVRNESVFTNHNGKDSYVIKTPCDPYICLTPSDKTIRNNIESPNLILTTQDQLDNFRTMETITLTKKFVRKIEKTPIFSFGIERINQFIENIVQLFHIPNHPNPPKANYVYEIFSRYFLITDPLKLTELLQESTKFHFTDEIALYKMIINNLFLKQLTHPNYFFSYYAGYGELKGVFESILI